MQRLSLLLVLAAAASAQDYEAQLKDKLAKPFVKKGGWVLDYRAALEQAKAQSKVVFGYFTRSYAP